MNSIKNKTIWIISQDASTPETGIRNRHYILAREFVKQGHKVYLIAASYTHLLYKAPNVTEPYQLELIDGVNFLWVKMPYYKNAHSKKRVINWFLFAWKVRRLDKIISDIPDAILYSSPSLIGYLGCKSLITSFKKTRLVFEARDLWPLTMIKLGGYSANNPFIRFLLWVEYKAYNESDRVISCLENAVEHMHSRGMDPIKFSWIPNGFSVDEVKEKENLPENISVQLPENKFVVGYMGTLGLANAMESFILAADKLKEQKEISFVLVGDGKEKYKLMSLVKEKNLSNVSFINLIAKTQVQSMLEKFDVCYIGWENNSLYQFGISANKIAEYFIAGKPVVHAYSGHGDPVKAAKAGITVEANNVDLISSAIMEIFNLSASERAVLGRNGELYAIKNYEYGALANKLLKVLIG